VRGDWLRITQVVANLLGNSFKFTDAGGRVDVDLRADPDGRHALLAIRDTGIGIRPEFLERLFRPFSQIAAGGGKGRAGLGLGLALVRNLVAAHGGTVDVHSAGEGKGSEFVVRLPLEPAPQPRERRTEDARKGPQRPLRILIVEDKPETAEAFRLTLQLEGHQVAVAAGAEDALRLARESKPQVVFCDIGLDGEMDGYSIARAIRGDASYGTPYLVALTGYGQASDREKAIDAGFQQHLTKPADAVTIKRVLTEMPDRS
jgi:CheY-like chemotaxis protein